MTELIAFIIERHATILTVIWQHMYISAIAVVAGFSIAIPVGIVLTRIKSISQFVIGVVNIIQTIPTLALLGFMIPLIGIGTFPAIVALFLYSILPMLQNTYAGIRGVDRSIIEAAKGMGMTNLQILFKVEIPMSISLIMGGFRTATIYTISWATLASLIGGGGLGYLVFTGLTINNKSMLITGALAAALLALCADFFTRKVQKICTPRGLRY